MRNDTLITLCCGLSTLFGTGLALALQILEAPDWVSLTIAAVVGTVCGLTTWHLWNGKASK